MSRSSETRAWALASAGVLCLCAITYKVMRTPSLPDLRPTVAHIDAATGAWSDASKQETKAVANITHQIQVELWHSDRLMLEGSQTLSAARGAIGTLNGSLTHVAPLLDSLKASSDALPPVLQHVSADADTLTAQAGTVTANANGAVTDFRRFITAPALSATLGNAASMTGSWAAISGDAQRVVHKQADEIMKPVPWWKKPFVKGGQFIDIAAAVARHLP